MTSFEETFTVLSGHVDGAHRIDCAQVDRHHNLSFSINGTTWCRMDGDRIHKIYALDDTKIPLAGWASQQEAGRMIVLAYRPNKRLVIKDLDRGVIVKGYVAGHSVIPAQNHRVAANALSAVSGVITPALVRHDADKSAIELSYCDFAALHITQASCAEMERVGNAIAQMQHASHNAHTLVSPFLPDDELQTLLDWRTKIESVEIELPNNWIRCFNALTQSPPKIYSPVLSHRDLHDGQWLRSSSSLCLLDFDSLSLAHPMLDLGNFAAHVDLRYLQWIKSDDCSKHLKLECLLNGYAQATEVNLDAFCWFRTASLLRLALVYAIRPRWRLITNRLVEKAQTLIHENALLEL